MSSSSIEPATLAKLDGAITKALLIGVAGAVLFVVLLILGTAKVLPPIPTAIAAVGAFLLAAVGFAIMANKRMVRAVGRGHGWQSAACEVQMVGNAKRRRVRVRVDSILLEAADGYSNTNKLIGHDRLDVAGRSPGRFLVRVPGEQAIYVFRAISG